MNVAELNALLKQAIEHNKRGSYDEAESIALRVLSQLEELQGDLKSDSDNDPHKQQQNVVRGRAARICGEARRQRGDYPRALQQFAIAEKACREANDKTGTAKVMNCFANVYWALADYAQALEYYAKALTVSEEADDARGAAVAVGNIGEVYLSLSDYSQALEYFGKALLSHQELDNKAGAAAVTGSIGRIYEALSDYNKAFEYYGNALLLHEEVGDKRGIANVTGNTGVVYYRLGDYTRALEYYMKARGIAEELSDKRGLAIVTGNIAGVYMDLADHSLALEYFEKALHSHEEIGDKAGAARVRGNMGEYYRIQKDYARSVENLYSALQMQEDLGRKAAAGQFRGTIGSVYACADWEGRDEAKAEEYMVDSIAITEELGLKDHHIHYELSELYKRQQRWQESHMHFERFHYLKEDALSEEARKEALMMEHRRKIEDAERDRQIKLVRFQEQEKILHNILPVKIAERMVSGEKTIAELFSDVSIFFSDIVDFTRLSEKISPQELVQTLNTVFSEFDGLARKHGLEKIKTIGDAYMAVCGVPVPNERHAECVALFALDVHSFIEKFRMSNGEPITIRMGLHCGSVVAGIIGENKFAYDLWGDAVNIAARMESHGEAGKINCSADFTTHLQIRDEGFVFEERDEIEIKGKGMMRTYFLEMNDAS